ncbi:hypothetical protein DWB61_08685 [Ancylomarina euxinus]|uniref:Uncharacterized protein n=1 Tax=Ancylomarina euxinus TaxID=2283627 RepID=A0A425Y1U5_9BACT|nr:hypothetical protein [Ancylomarina euxinus]MCZ4695138.1 hypothetical protein [Ancylomarina euxinus]MUP14927.1 hypothetical protein [Ancylomarina euxinus]RRG21821.1 hypothetical protein DWB61_08685 [Ancylomarina euxinus]
MLEAFLISLTANLITNAGQTAFNKVFKKDNFYDKIQNAFNLACDNWAKNSDTRDRKKIFSKKNFELLIECSTNPNLIEKLDDETTELIELFKLELQKDLALWNYVDAKMQEQQTIRLIGLEKHIEKLITDFSKSLEGTPIRNKALEDVLVPYDKIFSHQLDTNNQNLPLQFHRNYLGRENEIQDLDYFIKYSDENTIAIIADGGYGKTRFCIEYFKQYIDTDEDFEALVLNANAFKCVNFADQLRSDKTIVVLFDDAHKHPHILDDLITLSNTIENLKLILTIRKASFQDTLHKLSTHNQSFEEIKLKQLPPKETKSLFRDTIRAHESQILRYAELSKGIPIVILALCQNIVNGKNNSILSEEEFFSQFVLGIKRDVINDIHGKSYLEEEKINKTIELISFFSPILNIEEEINRIAELNEISLDDTIQIIDHLNDIEFIRKTNEISITPDPYSDAIFTNSANRLTTILKQDITPFTERFIRNLVEVENSSKLKCNVSEVLNKFITSFNEPDSDINTLNRKLETLRAFAYKKPKECYLALKYIINSHKSDESFWLTKEDNLWNSYSLKKTHELIVEILSVIAINIQKEQDFNNLYQLIWIYGECTQELTAFSKIFRYREYDFDEFGYHPSTICARQSFLIDKLNNYTQEDISDEVISDHIYNCCKTLLVLEFDIESIYDKHTGKISIGQRPVTQNEITENIRLRAFDLLFNIYSIHRKDKVSRKYLESIVRTLFYCKVVENKKYTYNQDKEIDLVYEFLFKLLKDSPHIYERITLIRQIKLFERREIQEKYQGINKELLELVEHVDTAKESLNLLLHHEFFTVKNNIDQLFQGVLELYDPNWETLFIDLIEIKSNMLNDDYSNFHEILSHLIKIYPKKAISLLDLVIEQYPKEVNYYSTLIRATNDQDYFYSTIQKIWENEEVNSKRTVVWMLTYGRNQDTTLYQETDLEFFEEVIKTKNKEVFWALENTLPQYLFLSSTKTLALITEILKVEELGRMKGALLQSLFDEKELVEKHKDEVKDFIFNETIKIPLDTTFFESALSFLDLNFGFETLFKYLQEKFEDSIKQQDYLDISLTRHYNYPHKKTEDVERNFLTAIEWYTELNKKNSYHLELVEYLRPINIDVNNFSPLLTELINKYEDLNKLLDLFDALNTYENRSEEFVAMIITIANKMSEKFTLTEKNLIQLFSSEFIYNMGSKCGTGYAPFPQDIAHRDLIKKLLESCDIDSKVSGILNGSLIHVQKEIDRFKDKGDKRW